MNNYSDLYASWQNDPMGFWAKNAENIDWYKDYDQVQAEVDGLDRWFVGGKCNTSYNCLDRHVANGLKDQTAIIYDSPVTNSKRKISYGELLDQVEDFASALQSKNVQAGDRVIIYMPMIPEAAIAMLACARIGAIHSVVFGGFAANELATRIDDSTPKLIVAASCGIEPNRVVEYKPLLDEAVEIAKHKIESKIIFQREMHPCEMQHENDYDWDALVKAEQVAGRKAKAEQVDATDPLYVLYTSGTTGTPKGVVRDNGGHMVSLYWSMKHIYNIDQGDVFWAASDVGWVVGHSYIVYAPLLKGATTVLFEGKPIGTPDAGTFWRMIEEYQIKALFTAPTAFRAIKKEDPNAEYLAKYDTSCLETLFLAGERADPDTIKWAENHLKVPVIDHWWQTETGWAIAANLMGVEALPIKYGSPTKAVPGYDIQVLSDEGETLEAGVQGNIVIKRPLPPGCLPTLWNADDTFKEKYMHNFEGYYETADAGFIDEDGYVFIMARTDDIINVAGHRLSTGSMEEILAGHPDIAECAVIGVEDKLKGQMPVGLIILNNGCEKSEEEIYKECVTMMRETLGPVAAYKTTISVKRLPKTRSGKILRATMRSIADQKAYKDPATIDDISILDEIKDRFTEVGLIGR